MALQWLASQQSSGAFCRKWNFAKINLIVASYGAHASEAVIILRRISKSWKHNFCAMNYQGKSRKLVENMYVHNGTILFIRHGIDVEIGLGMAIVNLVHPPLPPRGAADSYDKRASQCWFI